MKIKDVYNYHRFDELLKGEDVLISEKRLKDATFFYENVEGVDLDTLLYNVYAINPKEVQKGSLCWGLSVLYPVLINGECNMTRGHFHKDLEADEIYVGQSGEGLLLYMDQNGETWAERVSQGSYHYISGQYAHRLVNIGTEPLKVICCWPANAGHDYEAVEKLPFKYRIFKKQDEIIFKEVR